MVVAVEATQLVIYVHAPCSVIQIPEIPVSSAKGVWLGKNSGVKVVQYGMNHSLWCA